MLLLRRVVSKLQPVTARLTQHHVHGGSAVGGLRCEFNHHAFHFFCFLIDCVEHVHAGHGEGQIISSREIESQRVVGGRPPGVNIPPRVTSPSVGRAMSGQPRDSTLDWMERNFGGDMPIVETSSSRIPDQWEFNPFRDIWFVDEAGSRFHVLWTLESSDFTRNTQFFGSCWFALAKSLKERKNLKVGERVFFWCGAEKDLDFKCHFMYQWGGRKNSAPDRFPLPGIPLGPAKVPTGSVSFQEVSQVRQTKLFSWMCKAAGKGASAGGVMFTGDGKGGGHVTPFVNSDGGTNFESYEREGSSTYAFKPLGAQG